MGKREWISNIKTKLVLFAAMLLFKFASELGYCQILIRDTSTYRYDFNAWKYINGLIWCIVLFCFIRHERKKVSTFMLYLTYLVQIIPITVIYAFANESVAYYNLLCLSFLMCELICGWIKRDSRWKPNCRLSAFMISAFAVVLILVLVYIYKKNGLPSLVALNIYKVYEIRRSGAFQVGKYANYLLEWVTKVIIPFLLAKSLCSKRWFCAGLLSGSLFVIYLYSGHKSYLFALPLVIVCTLWAKRKEFYKEIFGVSCSGFFVLVLLACFSPIAQSKFASIYSLLGRRVMMVSANNKFVYYDFFSRNPKLGLAGVFPTWLIYVPNYYANVSYPNLISEIYYGKPDMYSNTGFFAEGYMRFGHIGTVLIFILFAWVLLLMDKMQKRAGYVLTVGAFVYRVFMLTDNHLFDALVFGDWMLVIILMIFYVDGKQSYIKTRKKISIKWSGFKAV